MRIVLRTSTGAFVTAVLSRLPESSTKVSSSDIGGGRWLILLIALSYRAKHP